MELQLNERAKFVGEVEKLLPKSVSVTGESLLSAYAVLWTLKSEITNGMSNDEILRKADELCNIDCFKICFEQAGLLLKNFTDIASAVDLFGKYQKEEFLKLIAYDLVAQAKQLLSCIKELQLAANKNHMLYIATLILEMRSLSVEGTSMKELQTLFNQKCAVSDFIKLSNEMVAKMYRAIMLYDLPTIQSIFTPSKELAGACHTLSSDLELSHSDQMDFAAGCYRENQVSSDQLLYDAAAYPFFGNKDNADRKKKANRIARVFIMHNSLDVLAAISVAKKARLQSSSKKSETSYVCNDVSLQLGYVLPVFTSSLHMDKDDDRIAVFFPSVFFVREWIGDPFLNAKNATFVVSDERTAFLIEKHIEELELMGLDLTHISFVPYSAWINDPVVRGETLASNKILVFGADSPSRCDEVLKAIEGANTNSEVFALVPSYDSLENAPLVPGRLRLEDVLLVPQGINNSKAPKRKVLVHCVHAVNCTLPPRDTVISSLVLDKTTELQCLAYGKDSCSVKDCDLAVNKTIRKLFRERIYELQPHDKCRNAPMSYFFTPDIEVFYTVSSPQNSSRPRIDAYVCAPCDDKENGIRKGAMLKGTRKRTTSICCDDIEEWLENEYPYSSISPRSSAKARHSNEELTEPWSVRDEIIKSFSSYLAGQDIALKTFWYLYPSLMDYFSASDYDRLSDIILRTKIGLMPFSALTPERCMEELTANFPNSDSSSLLAQYRLLSDFVNHAVKNNYCSENPFSEILTDKRRADRLFRQVRNALTKKHLTEAEMQSIFQFVCDKIDKGDIRYLGVLMKLLSGIRSSIICGLRWKDLKKVPDYHFSEMIITRQVSLDGSSVTGFTDASDYRCYPCPTLLMDYFERIQETIKKSIPGGIDDLPIVCNASEVGIASAYRKALTPKALTVLCKDAIASLNLPEKIISLPIENGEEKETDLHSYGGDFFRENFQHWAQNLCKLTADEIQYLLGLTPETTFGRYYCDYINDASQLIMQTKLNRLCSYLSNHEHTVIRSFRKESITGYSMRFQGDHAMPTPLTVNLRLCSDSPKIEINAVSNYGVKITYGKVQEEQP